MGPSRWWFGAAGILALTGIIIGVLIIVDGVRDLDDTIDALPRVQVNSGEPVRVPAGTHRMWIESGPRFGDYRVMTTDGVSVLVRRTNSTFTYDFGSRSGVSFATITLDEPRDLVVVEASGSSATVAFGDNVAAELFTAIGLGALVCLGSIGIAIIVTIVVAVRRSRARKRAQPAYPAPSYAAFPTSVGSSLPPPPGSTPPPPSIPPPPPPPPR